MTAGAVGLFFAARKVAGEGLPTPMTLTGTLKLAVGVAVSMMGAKYLKDKKYIPTNISKP